MKKAYTLLVTIALLIATLDSKVIGQTPNSESDWYSGKEFSIQSTALGENRSYRVGLPKGYEKGEQQYPVIYLLDGQAYYFAAKGAVRALSSLSLMPEAIVVAIYNPDRQSDMTPSAMEIPSVNNKRGDQFLNFLEQELVPLIEKEYRTSPLRTLIGHSHGGIFSLYALAQKPDLFRFSIALDAPVHIDENFLEEGMRKMLTNKPTHAGRLVVGWNRYGWTETQADYLKFKMPAGFKVREIDMEGETHQSMYYPGIYKGLKSLFSDHAYKHTHTLSFDDISSRYRAISAEYGYDIPIPVWALRYGALDHLVAADASGARPFVEALEKHYGSAAIMGDNGRDWLNELETNPPKETRAQFMARPAAKVSQVKPFLGIWRGGAYQIEVSITKGKAQAVVTQDFPQGEQQVTTFSKITVMEDGSLDLVYENRMPPRTGLIYFQLGQISKNTSQVKSGFRVYWPGMAFRNQPKFIKMERN